MTSRTDLAGRMTAMGFPATPAEDVSYGYDDVTGGHPGVGRLTSITDQSGSTAFTYDDRGNVTRERRTIGTQVYDTDYAWDLADNLTQVTYPSGRIVAYTRDSLGRVTAVTTQEIAAAPVVDVVTNITYKPFGPVAGLTHGNSLALTLTYDQDYRLTGLVTGTTQDLSYGYDANNNITAITDAVTAARTQGYSYDALERLTQATGAYGTIDYAYDAVGNRTSRTVDDGSTIVTETSTIDAASNRLLSVADGSTTRTLTHDAAGNVTADDGTGVTRTLGYNDQGRLISITEGALPVASYLHNALGERVKKDSGGGVTHYHYDQSGRLIAESDGTTGAAKREYIQLAGLPLALVVDIATSPTLQHVHADHLGAPQKMTDGVGALIWDAAYTPFGLEHAVTGTAANDQRFPGQLKDGESGYHYNYFRTYDPSLGRYLRSDPIGLAGGLNRYAYTGGNPVNQADPFGLYFSAQGYIWESLMSGLRNRSSSCPVPQEFDPQQLRDGDKVATDGSAADDDPPKVVPPTKANEGEQQPTADTEERVRGLPPEGLTPPVENAEDLKVGPASRPSEQAKGGKSLWDEDGGEWRYSPDDKYHNPHWDYNPHDSRNSAWQNVPIGDLPVYK